MVYIQMEIAMPAPTDAHDLDRQRKDILSQLAGLGDLRPGTLAQQFRKCGKPNCRCATDKEWRHGPRWVLTWKAEGKSQGVSIPDDAVEQTREQIAECARARILMRELIEVSTRLCDAHLEAIKGAKKRPHRGRRAGHPPRSGRRGRAPDRRRRP